jgi:hypothetical protein
MAKFSFGVNALFTLLTILTVGMSSGLLIAVIVFFRDIGMAKVDSSLFIGIIIALGVSVLILLYCIYASCFGGSCQKVMIAVLFLAYALPLIALGISIVALKSKLKEQFCSFWESRSEHPDAVEAIEASLDCCGWDSSDDSLCANSTRQGSCGAKIDDYYQKYGIPAGGALLGLGVLLLIGTAIAIRFICKAENSNRQESVSGEQKSMGTALTYGW